MISPSQAAPVAAEYRREEQREQRAMDSKTIPKFSTSLFNKGDRANSVTSAGSKSTAFARSLFRDSCC